MKQLSKEALARVTRELDSAPALKRWLHESRQYLYEWLAGCDVDEFQHLQGQINTINQILDKDPDKE